MKHKSVAVQEQFWETTATRPVCFFPRRKFSGQEQGPGQEPGLHRSSVSSGVAAPMKTTCTSLCIPSLFGELGLPLILLIALVENRHMERGCLTASPRQSALLLEEPGEIKGSDMKAASFTGTGELL